MEPLLVIEVLRINIFYHSFYFSVTEPLSISIEVLLVVIELLLVIIEVLPVVIALLPVIIELLLVVFSLYLNCVYEGFVVPAEARVAHRVGANKGKYPFTG